MDQRDVALIGLGALSAAVTACGPFGGQLAFLGGSIYGILKDYGGSSTAPSLTGADIERIINEKLLGHHVRDAGALISSVHDWYREWTVRAKSGEVFTPADLADFDHGYATQMGPQSGLRQGLALLYSKPANLASTPGQFGVPYVILGVGLWVDLLELGIARTVARGETVSLGEWQNFTYYLQYWMDGITTCDRLASHRVDQAVRAKMREDPSIKPGTKALADLLKSYEILFHGGASADGELPALTATKDIVAIQLRLEATGHAP
jgi:hypothetical protein